MLEKIFIFIGPLIASALTWLVTRDRKVAETRKLNAEAAAVEIKNNDSIIKLFRQQLNDLSNDNIEMNKRITGLKNDNRNLHKEMEKLTGIEQNCQRQLLLIIEQNEELKTLLKQSQH